MTFYKCKSCPVHVEIKDGINKTERGICCDCIAEKAIKDAKFRVKSAEVIHVFDEEVWA